MIEKKKYYENSINGGEVLMENTNKEYLKKYAEKKANSFNIMCLVVLSALALVALILNEVDIFTIDKFNMRFAMIQLSVYGLIPVSIYLVHDKILRRSNSILEYDYFKVFVLLFSYVSVMFFVVATSYHSTLLLAVPPLMASQYRNNKRLSLITFIASILLVIIFYYGSFIFGEYDSNLLKPLTAAEANDFNRRIEILTPKRMLEVFLHYVAPTSLCVAAIDFIGLSISKRTSEMLDIQIDLSNKVNEEIIAKANMQNSVIEDLADVIESRDIETGEHIKRTKLYVTILVNKMKQDSHYKDVLDDKLCENIINAAPLHDIGKIVVSDLILCKPGKLTDDEFDKMKVHTTKGAEIISKILDDLEDEDFLHTAYDIALSHHEKWDGRGYPNGIKEEEIPLSARIMAIADVFDALVAERVYKKPMPVDDAINIIKNDAGTHFDPYIVNNIFVNVLDDFKKVALE
ncbi:MAG: HD domain-containing protein [Acholeplasmatales bacterium]|nr:HD domain-containing protein [Acholeplasmatales bacterium]